MQHLSPEIEIPCFYEKCQVLFFLEIIDSAFHLRSLSCTERFFVLFNSIQVDSQKIFNQMKIIHWVICHSNGRPNGWHYWVNLTSANGTLHLDDLNRFHLPFTFCTTAALRIVAYVKWRPVKKFVLRGRMKWLLINFMIFLETAYCRSQRHILGTCIDGNACKENSADERWVGIGVLLTQLGSIE